ncbi:CPBP family intramembrane metalloprotease [Natronococcus amylolyticus]|uniref:CPBP family intramembrane metalloprotease n=1 Tax=Natronococcus amylolyticus TaxID=44470 RepID=UPI001F4C8D71|nr:CPBP family intramembrane metalloprotease [Natronococcus amylolyticus]
MIALQMEPSWTRWILSGFLSALGPAIAAVIVVHVSDDDLRAWARGIVHWRVHPKWYVAAIGIPAAIALSAAAMATLLGGPIDFGAFSPNLLTLVFGVLWGGWHLPLFFDPAAPHAQWPLASQLSYFVGIVGFSVLLAWVYNGSRGSILLVMIMHGSENALGALVPLDVDLVIVDGVPDWGLLVSLNISHVVVTWVFALTVIMVVGTGLRATRLSAVGTTGTTQQHERA